METHDLLDTLIDNGADISVIATNKSLLDRNACKTVSGIGGNQLIGPKKKFCIRFTCNQNREYDAWLSPTVLDSNQELVILGRDFLNQFDSTEFDWRKSQVNEMVENDIIEPSCSPHNSNPLLTKKKDGTMRFVIDFRSVNKNTIQDTYPLPCVQEMIDQTFGN